MPEINALKARADRAYTSIINDYGWARRTVALYPGLAVFIILLEAAAIAVLLVRGL